MKALVVTLAYRRLGQAILSQMKAADAYAKPLDWLTIYGNAANPKGNHIFQVVSDKYAEAQKKFLEGDWDTFIAIEDDMIISEDTFSRFESSLQNADVVYGVYVLRNLTDRYSLSSYKRVDEFHGDSISDNPELARQFLEARIIIPTSGVGLGITAIKRHCLETIAFERRDKHCNDWYFAVDCQKHGFHQVSDFGLLAGHMSLEPSPRILWPDVNAENLARIEYL